jgi:hypothetical protein
MPLEDSDIFKARIYENFNTEDARKAFVDDWQDFSSACETIDMKTDDIFRMYMHIIRAQKGELGSEIGLHKFFIPRSGTSILTDPSAVEVLMNLAQFWMYLLSGEMSSSETLGLTLKETSWKWLQCLNEYPNDYWCYPISVYYFVHKDADHFEDEFDVFLQKLLASLLVKFLQTPTVNAIKPFVYRLNAALYSKLDFDYAFAVSTTRKEVKSRLYSSTKIAKCLLYLHAYLNPRQEGLLPKVHETEHILPKKWQNTTYNKWTKAKADKYMDYYGNKVIIEKKLNIIAGNGYFAEKKMRYRMSEIADVLDLCEIEGEDWSSKDVDDREDAFIRRISDFLIKSLE